jgi:MFS family permease
MRPLRFFRSRAFTMTNIATLFMFFGLFGSVFLVAQFFQTVQGYGPLKAGLLLLPWTGMPLIVAPLAGVLSDRIGAARIMSVGLALLALGLGWLAAVTAPNVAYRDLTAPFVLSGIGMAAFLAPVGNVVLSAVREEEEGQASGANSAIRELGGVLGIAVLAAIFADSGGYGSDQQFADGMSTALWVGAGLVAVGAIAAHAVPGVLQHRRPFAAHWRQLRPPSPPSR